METLIPKVIERQGHLLRLEGVPGWVSENDMRTPCGGCGGTIFRIAKGSLFCPQCVPPAEETVVLGQIDLSGGIR